MVTIIIIIIQRNFIIRPIKNYCCILFVCSFTWLRNLVPHLKGGRRANWRADDSSDWPHNSWSYVCVCVCVCVCAPNDALNCERDFPAYCDGLHRYGPCGVWHGVVLWLVTDVSDELAVSIGYSKDYNMRSVRRATTQRQESGLCFVVRWAPYRTEYGVEQGQIFTDSGQN
jgi:hypothetical protein